MRWVTSSSSDVISFYSLADGVQHVLPFLVGGDALGKSIPPGSSENAADAETSLRLRHPHEQPRENAKEGRSQAAESCAALERSRQAGRTACARRYSAAGDSAALSGSTNSGSRSPYQPSSLCSSSPTGGGFPVGGASPPCRDGGYYRNRICQQSLGYVTTCVFSGGWGGYDETEVTVGTTEGYVYALPALWPPSAAFPCAHAHKRGEGAAACTCRSCCSASAAGLGEASVDQGDSTACLHVPAADGASAADRSGREAQTEETSSLPFPTSYVATPVNRFLRLPYTVQHLQMLGAHTPTLAGDYHDELLWLQQQPHRQRRSAAARCPVEKNGPDVSDAEERCFMGRGSRRGCGNPSCVACASCCCFAKPLLSTYSDHSCTSYSSFLLPPDCCSGSSGTPSAAHSSAVSPPAASASSGQSSGHSASRVQQFFSSDRLLLALDKGGNGVVAHWPAPQYLLDSPLATFTSAGPGRSEGNVISRYVFTRSPGPTQATKAEPAAEGGCVSKAASWTASTPLAASFTLNLSVQCCASNPIVTPLLAVVPSVVAAGGLRLLSVFDLVTSSFVFYARPPLTPAPRLATVGAEQEQQQQQEQACPRPQERQHHHRYQRPAYAEGDPLGGRMWSNVCCLSSSPSAGAALRQPGGARGLCGSTSCGSASTGRGLPLALGAPAARNMPIRVSSLTWLPALHPLLLGASTNSGLLLLYDLRASPHPVFCAARSPAARATGSIAASRAGDKGAPAHTAGTACGFADAARRPRTARQAASAAAAAALAEKPSAAPEAASAAGKLPGAAGPMDPQKAWPSEALDKDTSAGPTTDNSIRRGRSLAVRTDGKKEAEMACEGKCGARRVSRSNSRCSGGKRRRMFAEDGRYDGKALDEEPMSISFLATPAWLTSAATSHDAAILPCGCSCCRARAAMVRNVQTPCCASAALPITSTHQKEEKKGSSAGSSGPSQDLTQHARRSCSRHGRLEDEHSHEAAGRAHAEIEVGVKDTKEVSLFGGCAANVVIKPRNSSRPRPQFRKRAGAKRGSFSVLRRPGRTAAMMSAGCGSAKMPTHLLGSSKEFPGDASHCEGRSLPCEAVPAAACAEVRTVCGDTRPRSRTHRKTRDTSWRKRWFAKEEKAIVNFFSETYMALLSRGAGRRDAAVAPTMDTGISKTRRAVDPLSCRHSCHPCSVCSSVNGTTESALSDPRPALRRDIAEKEEQEKDLLPADGECSSVSSSHSQPLLSAGKTGARTTTENTGATENAGCVSSAAATRLGDVASQAEPRREMLSSVRLSRTGVSSGAHTSSELPFYLLRLASSPCSVLSGFPCLLWSSNQMAFLPSGCPSTQSPFVRFPDISTAYVASCFFSLFARLLYAHRLDQHAAARRLSHHQQRQLLKLLHAVDCTDSASLSQGPSAVDAAISAAAAAEVAAAEARSAAVAARAAGVDVTTTPGAAAAGSDAVQPEAPRKAGIFLHPSVASVPTKCQSLQGEVRTEESSNSLSEKSAAFQGMPLSSSVCSSSSGSHTSVFRSPESFETLRTRETSTRLLGFEKKLLSLYADVLLNRGCRAVPRTPYSEESSITFPVRDTIEKILPEFYRRHAQNCMNLLRYAADVLYAFGDGAPVLAQKSSAAEKAVQAAAACAASLESDRYLFSVSGPAGGCSAGFSADDLMTPLASRRDCAAAREKQEETSKPDGIAAEQASNDAQENQPRCGCGRVEAAVKAKARRWLADEFITEARLAARASRSKRSTFSLARKRTKGLTVTGEEGDLCPGERECSSAEDFVAEAHTVAAAQAVASSICVCELFQSETFFPVLFFNIFRGLCDGATGIPFCIQKNCIRSLPVSDVAYHKLARSQLRQLTRKRCKTSRASGNLSPRRQTQCLSNDICDFREEGRAAAQATCPPSSADCGENVCWRSCVRGTLPDRAAAAADLGRFDRAACDLSGISKKDETRTQQLLCLDERGRVYMLLVSLRVASGRPRKHCTDPKDRLNPAGGDAPSLPDVGRLVNRRTASHCDHKPHEGRVADGLSPQQRETFVEHHSSQSEWNEGTQERDPADFCGAIHTQLRNSAVCTSKKKLTCASDATEGHAVTGKQETGERRRLPSYFERACSPECSTVRKNLLWGPEGTEELLQLEKNDQDFVCWSEREDGFREQNNFHKKMWNQRWLCRRRRIEWCGACRPVANGASCTIPGTSENVFLDDVEKSENSAESRRTSCTSSVSRSYAVKCQEQTSGGGDDIGSAETTGHLAVSPAAKKLHLGRGRTSCATQGFRAMRKKGKRYARFIKENDKSAIAERVISTTAAAGLAQINANRSLLRLFPLLPLWNSCSKPQYLWRLRRKLHEGCCSQNRILSRLPWTKTHSHVNCKSPQRMNGGRAASASQTEERCNLRSQFPTRALGISNKLEEVSNVACSVPGSAPIAQVLHTYAPSFCVASGKKIDTSFHNQCKEEKRTDFCRRVCCRLQVEEEASFDINGKTNHGYLGSDGCRSRVVSLAMHENGRYILAATCAPSFLLYSSSRMGPLPPYQHKDRLLFGCATGTVPPSRPFRLLSISRGASFSRTASMCPSYRGVSTVLLPGAPSGPRPPPPVLISASPILPPGAAAPFVPHTLLRRQLDHGAACGISCDGSVSTQRLTRCRPALPVSLGRQSAHVECGVCGRRSGDPGQAAFSDWLTDEEDEKELHGGASGSETGSASDA